MALPTITIKPWDAEKLPWPVNAGAVKRQTGMVETTHWMTSTGRASCDPPLSTHVMRSCGDVALCAVELHGSLHTKTKDKHGQAEWHQNAERASKCHIADAAEIREQHATRAAATHVPMSTVAPPAPKFCPTSASTLPPSRRQLTTCRGLPSGDGWQPSHKSGKQRARPFRIPTLQMLQVHALFQAAAKQWRRCDFGAQKQANKIQHGTGGSCANP